MGAAGAVRKYDRSSLSILFMEKREPGRRGRRWVGDPAAWRIVALDPASPHLPLLASQQRRWALWVDSDADAFRRAYRTLKILRRHPGPSRLLALHAPGLPRAGLLSNLQHGARHFLDIELVVLSP